MKFRPLFNLNPLEIINFVQGTMVVKRSRMRSCIRNHHRRRRKQQIDRWNIVEDDNRCCCFISSFQQDSGHFLFMILLCVLFILSSHGGTGGVKAIGNYAAVMKAQSAAKAKGCSDVLYLDCVENKYVEEVSSSNVFIVKGNLISTPAIKGTILPGITRKSIIDVARSRGFQEGVGRSIRFGVVMLFEHTRVGEFDFARNYLLQQ